MKRYPGDYSGLTAKQAELLSFIRSEAAEGRTPSFREIMAALNVASLSSVHRLMAQLAERGRISKTYSRNRGTMLIDGDSCDYRTVPIEALFAELQRRGVILEASRL